MAADRGRGGRDSIYRGHLSRIFPEAGPAEVDSIVREFWKTHQRAFLGLFNASRLTGGDAAAAFAGGREQLDSTLEAGRGALLLAPHFGDERTLHILLSLAGYGISVLSTGYDGAPGAVRRYRLSESMRLHRVMFPGDNPRWMYRALAGGEVVQLAPTGYGGPGGIWVTSFGVPVLAPATPFRLRSATGCDIFLAVNHALAGMAYRIELTRLDLPVEPGEAARELFRLIDALGRGSPGQYNWMNLAIRHRETNTIARLGRVPSDERELESAALPSDGDPSSVLPGPPPSVSRTTV